MQYIFFILEDARNYFTDHLNIYLSDTMNGTYSSGSLLMIIFACIWLNQKNDKNAFHKLSNFKGMRSQRFAPDK